MLNNLGILSRINFLWFTIVKEHPSGIHWRTSWFSSFCKISKSCSANVSFIDELPNKSSFVPGMTLGLSFTVKPLAFASLQTLICGPKGEPGTDTSRRATLVPSIEAAASTRVINGFSSSIDTAPREDFDASEARLSLQSAPLSSHSVKFMMPD
jgi:hypothetical protein